MNDIRLHGSDELPATQVSWLGSLCRLLELSARAAGLFGPLASHACCSLRISLFHKGFLDFRHPSLGAEPAAFPAAQGKEFVREEIAAALHWSAGTASVRLHDAETMVEALPATVALLADGDVSYAHARAVADAVQRNVLDAARRSRQTPHRRLPDG